MRINHNIAALNTYRQLTTNSTAGSKSLEKLSSGLRINRAGDDAAGLAISEKMRAQIRGLNQAQRNAQDGISMIQTTEGALNETHSILQRMRELAAQAANDTNVDVDRQEIQKEINQLTSEINRIGNTTEFNTQSLLRGKNVPVVETAAQLNTITEGVAGQASVEVTGLVTDAKSVKAASSHATVQASSSEATGSVGNFKITKNSVAGAQGTVSLGNGITFSTTDANGNLNGATVKIVQSTSVAPASISLTGTPGTSSAVYTIELGADADGKSLFTGENRGELYNYLKDIMDKDPTNSAGIQLNEMAGSITDEKLTTIVNSATISGGRDEVRGEYQFELTDAIEEAGDTITIGGHTFTAVFGAANSAKGEFSIGADEANLYSAAEQAIDSTGNTNGTLLQAIEAVMGDRLGNNSSTGTTIKLIENATKAVGSDLTAPTIAGAGTDDILAITDLSGKNLKTVTIAQAGNAGATSAVAKNDATNFISITAGTSGTELNGVTIKFTDITAAATADMAAEWDAKSATLTISGVINSTAGTAQTEIEALIQSTLEDAGFSTAAANVTLAKGGTSDFNVATLDDFSLTFGAGANGTLGEIDMSGSSDELYVTQSNGNLTIYLADTTTSKNAAAEIQAKVRELATQGTYTGGVDFSKYVFEGQGNWDTRTLGNSLKDSSSTMVGGTEEVKGTYSFDVKKAFAAGDRIEIAGQVFKAVVGTPSISNGEFDVSSGDINTQVTNLRDTISLNEAIKSQYTISGSGAEIVLTEVAADGKDLSANDLSVRATGTQGEYTIEQEELLENGAKFIIDGEEISITNANAHVGYDNGTAVKVAETLADQSKALADAINTNANLKGKYIASVTEDGSLKLTQTEDFTTENAPAVSTKNSSIGDFTATFQIGANSGQSMTITVGDMRANALSLSGDGSIGTVAAQNGAVASYTAVANVNSGSDNKNVEFALDVTTSEKASAALSVINDAIEKVSSQRSQLGAFQNRLEHTINNLGTSSENLVASESRIRDVDMAAEMMEFTKNNILSQAAQAMLAQANQQPQGVLQLLR